MPSELEWACTAGLIDGDGCISMQGGNSIGLRKPIVVVDNTDMEILDELLRLHGGSLVTKKRYAANHRQAFSWRLYGSQHIRVFLALLYPYMRNAMKRERARMLIEEWPNVSIRNGRYTAEKRLVRNEFENRFMLLGEGRGSRA